MNQCSWKASIVTLFNGREVLSSSSEYRAECEARHLLGKPFSEQVRMLERIARQRGAVALAELKATMANVEPAFVLDLPEKLQRLAYLARTEFVIGQKRADQLRTHILHLHERRQSSDQPPARRHE
ncbi:MULTISPECIES: DUF7696 family protein [Pseudomonas]|jgi:hypothetical protein|uniref:DUF7696 family protein n=1 Tax=Pseudomonas TaxID=286 RepID=UPI00235FE1FF|nr:hypothetical protein [Pseudomonas sp. TNT2022 ID642]MDD1003601.1 hypothetical protein [Pseudomonas sp. TNT2022 ID642]